MGFFSKIITSIIDKSRFSKFIYDENNYEIKFNLLPNQEVKIKLSNPIYIESHDKCTSLSYVLKDKNEVYGNIFVEYIEFFNECSFTTEPRGVYESYIKDKLHLNSLQVEKKFIINESEFITYLVNDEYLLSFIHIYANDKNVFIVDCIGKLFKELATEYTPDIRLIEEKYSRANLNMDLSLVKDNARYNYIEENTFGG